MESPTNLETNGSLRINPLAEMLVEIAQNNFNGSLRVAHEANKTVVYFDAGEPIFAVSNVRSHRLFEMLLQAGKVTKEQLLKLPDFASDLALKESLLKNNLMPKAELDAVFALQVREILQSALVWRDGEWTFSPMVRVRGDIRISSDFRNLLIEHARNLPALEATRKFKNPQESLKVSFEIPGNVNLSPPEFFVFSRFENSSLPIEEIQKLSGLPEAETFQILYTLWLGGFIKRQNWYGAFSERAVAAILSAKLAVKKDDSKLIVKLPVVALEPPPAATEVIELGEKTPPDEKEISLDEYLTRIERANNFYEVFAVVSDVAATEIKQIYFALAKRFHPDLFYKENDADLVRRVQQAFTKLAQAYETLKQDNLREVYDFRMRKELAQMKTAESSESSRTIVENQQQTAQAAENFEQGFDLLSEQNYLAATPLLARAVHFDKNNARYHAYYGKALSTDKKQRHKAENELQTAVKLDGKNADYRLMLAEFFVQIELFKRAEGELNRLLSISPNNRPAKTLLDRLPKK